MKMVDNNIKETLRLSLPLITLACFFLASVFQVNLHYPVDEIQVGSEESIPDEKAGDLLVFSSYVLASGFSLADSLISGLPKLPEPEFILTSAGEISRQFQTITLRLKGILFTVFIAMNAP